MEIFLTYHRQNKRKFLIKKGLKGDFMKIKVPKDLKFITSEDKPIIDVIREFCKEIEINDYVPLVLFLAGVKCLFRVKTYEITAEFAKNKCVWNYYGDIDEGVNTEDFDVWVEFSVLVPFDGFYVIGVYLSDLLNREFDDRNDDEIRENMYIQKYPYWDK